MACATGGPPAGMVRVPGGAVVPAGGGAPLELAPFDLDRALVSEAGEPLLAQSPEEAAAHCAALGRRLPTDAEWSRAAAADLGLEDLQGSAFQVTASRFVPRGPEERIPGFQGPLSVLRGSCCPFVPGWSDPAHRAILSAGRRSSFVGFRCAAPAGADDPNLALDASNPVPFAALDTAQPVRLLIEGRLGPEREPSPEPLLARLRALGPGARVADVGCGLGGLSFEVAALLGPEARVWAVDVDPAVLEFVAGWAAEQGLAQVVPHRSAEGDLGLPEGSLDAVLLYRMAVTLGGLDPGVPERLLASCARALAATGVLIAVEPLDPGEPPPPFAALEAAGFTLEAHERAPRGGARGEDGVWVFGVGS